jgi:hypothetical protein
MLCIAGAVTVYVGTARPLPLMLRALTIGFKASGVRFMTELLLLLRKWAIMVAGISFKSAYWVLLVCVLVHIVVWIVLIRWKPFSTYGSQFHARATQVMLLLFMVTAISMCSMPCACEHNDCLLCIAVAGPSHAESQHRRCCVGSCSYPTHNRILLLYLFSHPWRAGPCSPVLLTC